MKRLHLLYLSSMIVMVVSSCVTPKDLTYLQYSSLQEQSNILARDQKVSVTPSDYKIMPYDNLFIRVLTPDPQWSVIFNSMPSGGNGGAVTEESAALLGYPVDSKGNIEIPFVGKMVAGGKTLYEIKNDLDSIFKKYLKDAAITVRLVNNFVTIIGEVGTPGRYPIPKDRINVFEALAMAGDMNLYGNRQKLQLIRPSPYGPIIKEFSLSDRSILTSEYFYVMPNDIIYAQPNKGRGFQNNSSIYTVFLTTITTALVILRFLGI
jgi:polysaccharide biosynthesis/export protein